VFNYPKDITWILLIHIPFYLRCYKESNFLKKKEISEP
jgi:hypothetical protein